MSENNNSIRFIENCYRLYERKMYSVAYAILKDEWLAEDAVMDAFERLMKQETVFEEADSYACKQYIITVIKRVAIDIYNKRRKQQERTVLTDKDEDFEMPGGEWSFINEQDSLAEYISRLPKKYRDVVRLTVEKNMTSKEVSDRLGISEAAVRKRYERAKKKLAEMMKKSEE